MISVFSEVVQPLTYDLYTSSLPGSIANRARNVHFFAITLFPLPITLTPRENVPYLLCDGVIQKSLNVRLAPNSGFLYHFISTNTPISKSSNPTTPPPPATPIHHDSTRSLP